MRSMLAGVAETGSETAQRLEGFASVRSTLAGLAERRAGGSRRLTDEVYFAKDTSVIGDDIQIFKSPRSAGGTSGPRGNKKGRPVGRPFSVMMPVMLFSSFGRGL